MKSVKIPTGLLNEKQKRDVVEVGNLKITKNAIYFVGSVLQISNINHIYITKFMKAPFPKWTILGILIGILTIPFVVGIAILALSIYFLYQYYKETRTDKFGLNIQMSSGFCMVIGSEDYIFLQNIQQVIADNFVEKYDMPAIINLDNKQIVIEKNDGIVNTGNYANNEYNTQE